MNSIDPTMPAHLSVGPVQELSVEEMAALLADSCVGPTLGAPDSLTAPEAAATPVLATPIPSPGIPPLVLRKRAVSGRYRVDSGGWRLELRVDVDGVRPMNRVSGDFFQISGGTVSYFGSFVVNTIALAVTAATVTITGVADTTWASPYNHIKVTIPRVIIFNPPAGATVQWSNSAGSAGATYTCPYLSLYLRTVELEQDAETGITPFTSYATGSLPSGGPARTLSVAGAYAEARIEMVTSGVSDLVGAAPGGTWDDAELHNAMVNHFSLWQDTPQWKVWLFHATKYVQTSVLGIMFDQQGKQRQGCAVFYKHPLMDGSAATNLRYQLFCCVHELGHTFNLFHTFARSYMTPPAPNTAAALSWMNYPQLYVPGGGGASGEAPFWLAFPFQYDEVGLVHLRHGFRNSVIMGGNPFGVGATLSALADFDDPVEDRSGLKLELRTDRSFELGEPVVIEIKLSAPGGGSRAVNPHLHPDASFVRFAIQKPGGEVVIHEPVLEKCVAVETVKLNAERPAIYDSAYLGYGRQGLNFAQPGVYRVRAVYSAQDGSRVVSNPLEVRVRPPLTQDDGKVAELLMGHEQGLLLYLLGSDSAHLASGNAALAEIVEKHATHPLAAYARLVAGWAAARPFKDVAADGEVTTRKAKPTETGKMLNSVISASDKGRGVDNITLSQTFCRLARTQQVAGDTKAAESTVKRMASIFKAKGLKAHVLDTIEAQGNAALKTDE